MTDKSAHEVLGDAKKALQFLKSREQVPDSSPVVASSYDALHEALIHLEATGVRLGTLAERLETQERSHQVAWASHRSDYDEASREITRLRQEHAKMHSALVEARRVPDEDSERGQLLLDSREAIEWLASLQTAQISEIRRDNFGVVARTLGRLENMARVLLAHQPEAIELNTIGEALKEAVDAPGPYDAVQALARAVSTLTKVVDREQRARLAKENGR